MTQPKEPLPYRTARYLGRVAASYTIFGAITVVNFLFGKYAYGIFDFSFKGWMTSLAYTAIAYVLVDPIFRHWRKP